MSYILDALKKSDQERQQNNGPTLQTVQRPQLTASRPAAGPWPVVALSVVLVLLLVLAGGYYVFFVPSPVSVASQAPAVINSPAPAIATPAAEAKPVTEPPATAISEAVPPPPALPVSKPVLVELWQLPDDVQQQLPAMTFSFHVYSDNPQRRTIIINKRRVKQGDTIASGLVLEEITEQGIILDWQSSHRFTINVVDNW